MGKSKKPKFPKFIHYAAHAETLSLFYEGLGIHRPVRADPGEALFFEFFKEDGQHYVRLIQKNSKETIIKLIEEHDKIPVEEFH